jgi:hypothetical protein
MVAWGLLALASVSEGTEVQAPQAFTQAPQTFTAAQLREDLDALEAALARVHPNIAHSVAAPQLTQALANMRARLDRPMTRDEAWVAMSTLNPVFADGHLVVALPGGPNADIAQHIRQGGVLFPFNVHVDARGEIFIDSKASGEATPLQRSRIEAIDGVPGREVAARLLEHINGDTAEFRTKLISRRFAFLYRKLFGDRQSFRLRIAGVESSFAGTEDIPRAYSEKSFEQAFRFELRDAKRAVLTIEEFYWPDKSKFYELTKTAFARMREAGTQTLVIDIRANGGGDDDMWLEGILPYIATKPYRNGSDYVVKVIEGRQRENQKVGDVVQGTQSWYQPADNALRFQGRVFVLIGPATYSSSVLFTNVMHDFGFATIAGTGGAARSTQSGGTQSIKLPNTGLNFVVPRFILKRPSGEEGLLQPGILIVDDPYRPSAAVETLLNL